LGLDESHTLEIAAEPRRGLGVESREGQAGRADVDAEDAHHGLAAAMKP
jgi:hypothetical protein